MYLGHIFINHNTHPIMVLNNQICPIKSQGTCNRILKKKNCIKNAIKSTRSVHVGCTTPWSSFHLTTVEPLGYCTRLLTSLLALFCPSPIHSAQATFLNCTSWDFPGSSVVKTPFFQCRGFEFEPWLGNKDPICHVKNKPITK